MTPILRLSHEYRFIEKESTLIYYYTDRTIDKQNYFTPFTPLFFYFSDSEQKHSVEENYNQEKTNIPYHFQRRGKVLTLPRFWRYVL